MQIQSFRVYLIIWCACTLVLTYRMGKPLKPNMQPCFSSSDPTFNSIRSLESPLNCANNYFETDINPRAFPLRKSIPNPMCHADLRVLAKLNLRQEPISVFVPRRTERSVKLGNRALPLFARFYHPQSNRCGKKVITPAAQNDMLRE